MNKCDGTENHSHYVIADSTTMTHTHKHSIYDKDFNRLHHHSPAEHLSCTLEEVENEVEYLETPF